MTGAAYSLVEELKAAIAGDPARRPLIVCGAGVSMASCKSAPSWPSLIADGVARLASLDFTPAGQSWAADAITRLGGADAGGMIAIADEVTARFGGRGDAEFAAWLEHSVGRLPMDAARLIEAILALDCPIATTNYDDLIARAGHRREISWSDHRAVLRVLSDEPSEGVIHLHGHWRDPKHVVLGSASYAAHGADERRDFLQKMAAFQRPTLFLGCSADGLADPDFGRLADWLRTMNDLSQRRYWLVPRPKLVPPDPGARLYGVVFGDSHGELPDFVAQLAPTRADALPPDPAMIGRTSALATAVGALNAGAPGIVIPGGPGMGKTTLGLATAYAPTVAARFGPERYFVALDARRTAHDMLTGFCLALGLLAVGGPAALINAVSNACAAHPKLVILDNLETPLERDGPAVEAALDRLFAIPGLTLILTVRGPTPRCPAARVLEDIQAMSADEGRELFLKWARAISPSDPDLGALLTALDGHALSIVLLARLSEGQRDLRVLRAAYQRERVNLLKAGGGDERLLSTRVSLRLSLQSPLMTSEAIGAVDLLAQSPAGLARISHVIRCIEA
jgi:hypothetical protein